MDIRGIKFTARTKLVNNDTKLAIITLIEFNIAEAAPAMCRNKDNDFPIEREKINPQVKNITPLAKTVKIRLFLKKNPNTNNNNENAKEV